MTPRLAHPAPRAAAALLAAALGLAHVPPALAGPAGVGASAASASAALGSRTLRTLEGRTLTLGALKGEVVIVNFWASWCAPCRRELPALDRLDRALSGHGGRVVAVSIDEDARSARQFAKERHLALTVVHDGPDGLARQLDLRHVPLTVVLDRNGAIAWTTDGSDEDALRTLERRVRELIDRPTAQAVDVSTGGSR